MDWLELKIPPVGQLLLHGVAMWSLARMDSGGRWTTPMLGGIALAHPGGMLLLPTFVLYMNRFQILPEERTLREKFGAPYEEYVSSVRRWL